jgi:hypothetical protein
VIPVDAAPVAQGPALHDRDDRQVRGEVAQLDEVADGALLVLGDGEAGLGGDPGFAHPVLRGGPQQAADLVAVAVTRWPTTWIPPRWRPAAASDRGVYAKCLDGGVELLRQRGPGGAGPRPGGRGVPR